MVIRFIVLLSRQLFRLVLLCCRTSRSKDVELLVHRQEVAVLRRQVNRPQVKPAERMVLAALQRLAPGVGAHLVAGDAGHAPTLASRARPAEMDPAPSSDPEEGGVPTDPAAGVAPSQGEPLVGLPPHPGRAA